MPGETGPVSPPLAVSLTITALFGMACLNCAEIPIMVLYTFRRYTGLYFWSIIVADLGTVIYAIVNLLRLFALAPNTLMSVLLALSWWGMVTGQSVILYSRLHLVVYNKKKTRGVLIMIITNFFIIHIPLSVLWIGCNIDPDVFLDAFNIYERLQLCAFFVQECIISGLYIWEAGHTLEPIISARGGTGKNIVHELVVINIIVIILDITLLVTLLTGHFYIQTSYQPLVYSIKLKLELFILNKLKAFVEQRPCDIMYTQYPQSQSCTGSPLGCPQHTMERACRDRPLNGRLQGPETVTTLEAIHSEYHAFTSTSRARRLFDIDYGTQ
ncbi:hypothetical protein B0I35DRAFT_403006 [Stachybotrys elegans]|uniref:DUF7703 domain-containing protein n=1 Tax=Stachybotrys elegans TaxID=80388 RepID=A0A8K0WJ23_9HYPO|nr:hypothetical protein B0I35DRAFT_403006 [Stachybotrys elegans]